MQFHLYSHGPALTFIVRSLTYSLHEYKDSCRIDLSPLTLATETLYPAITTTTVATTTMHLPTLVLTTLVTLTSAIPIAPPTTNDAKELKARNHDARGATIFKRANLAGESTFIPANNYCTDMSNIFGSFDGEVRSLSVEKGVKCDFYQ